MVALCNEKKGVFGRDYSKASRGDRHFRRGNSSLVKTRNGAQKEEEQSFLTRHWTLSSTEISSVSECVNEAHQKMGAYLRPYPESC